MDKREKVARRLRYIDYFYRQLTNISEWEALEQSQRNCYLNYASQLIKIIEEV